VTDACHCKPSICRCSSNQQTTCLCHVAGRPQISKRSHLEHQVVYILAAFSGKTYTLLCLRHACYCEIVYQHREASRVTSVAVRPSRMLMHHHELSRMRHCSTIDISDALACIASPIISEANNLISIFCQITCLVIASAFARLKFRRASRCFLPHFDHSERSYGTSDKS
jgi:hypothetical protein